MNSIYDLVDKDGNSLGQALKVSLKAQLDLFRTISLQSGKSESNKRR